MVEKHEVKRELKPVSSNRLLNKIMYRSHRFCSEASKKRINEIILSLLIKDYESLRLYSFEGLPQEMPLLRCLIWKINLKYLSINLDTWDDYVKVKRIEYTELKFKYIHDLRAEGIEFLKNSKDNNQESGYLKLTDHKLLEDIDKDIKRTHTYMEFFYMPCKASIDSTLEGVRKFIDQKREEDCIKSVEQIYLKDPNSIETNSDVITRILYIYSKQNTDVNYVQGMNEILAPIYFCFFNEEETSVANQDDSQKDDEYNYVADVEADSYWTFSSLMDDIKILFIKSKDKESGGVFSKLTILSEILKIVDKDLYNHFIKIKLDIQLFAFKWVVLLFTQDFQISQIMRVWDAILSETDRFYMVYLICVSILGIKRKELIKSDFAGCIVKLQKINNLNCEEILNKVNDIRKKFDKKIKKLLGIY